MLKRYEDGYIKLEKLVNADPGRKPSERYSDSDTDSADPGIPSERYSDSDTDSADPGKPSERYSDSDTDITDPGKPSERYSDSDTDITDPRKPESDDNLPSCSGAYHDFDISGENNLYYILGSCKWSHH